MENAVKFKTQEKDFLASLKKRVVENSDSPSSWNIVYNQLYIDDMLNYLRTLTPEVVRAGFGNYVAKTVVLIPTGEDDEPASIRQLLRSLGILPETVWITPYIKSFDIPEDVLVTYLMMEIRRINPSLIINISGREISTNIQVFTSEFKDAKNAIIQAKDCCKMV